MVDASPIDRLPVGVPTVHLAGDRDLIAPPAVHDAYAAAARSFGDGVRLFTIPGDGHVEAMTPYQLAGRAVLNAVRAILERPSFNP